MYLTVRVCRSIGAPERTAAARVSPGSLPSMTRFGTGEKFLAIAIRLVALQRVSREREGTHDVP